MAEWIMPARASARAETRTAREPGDAVIGDGSRRVRIAWIASASGRGGVEQELQVAKERAAELGARPHLLFPVCRRPAGPR